MCFRPCAYTWLVKECSHEIAPFFTKIINASLISGIFPSELKFAIVKPLLKRSNLDTESLANYRPVSNLPFLSKLLEKIVFSRIQKYLLSGNIRILYMKNRSTCYILFKIIISSKLFLYTVICKMIRSLVCNTSIACCHLDLNKVCVML